MTQTDLQTVGLDVQISGTPILRDVSLSVTRRELAVVIGPSGCGKSTLLRAIAGLRRASAGQILLGGEVVDDGMTAAPPERRRVGWVPQEAALFPHLTVAQNVAFGRGGRGGRGARLARVGGSDGEGSGLADRDLLDLTGLAALAERFPDQLSGGQAQRVALARALAAQPAVLLLDEPFAALDPTLRGELRDDLRRLLTALDVTALLVTHDQGEALELADTLVILREGQVIQHAAPERAYQHPATAWAASFLGETVVLEGDAHDHRVETVLGVIPLADPTRGAVRILVRPEQLRLEDVGGHHVAATVTRVRYAGHEARVDLRLDGGAEVLARVPAGAIPRRGDRRGIAVIGEAVVISDDRPAGDPAQETRPSASAAYSSAATVSPSVIRPDATQSSTVDHGTNS